MTEPTEDTLLGHTFENGEIVESNKIYRMSPDNYYEMLSETDERYKASVKIVHGWGAYLRVKGYAYVIVRIKKTATENDYSIIKLYVEGVEKVKQFDQ